MKSLLLTEENVEWLPLKNNVEFYRDTRTPKRDLITSVFVFAFFGDQILFTKHKDRGWDIPGGHIERNETTEDALKREIYEEACAKLTNTRVLGYFKIVLSEFNPEILNYPFPESYLLLYISHIDSLDPFVAEYETQERKFFPPEEAKNLFWVKRYRTIYDAAFKENMEFYGK